MNEISVLRYVIIDGALHSAARGLCSQKNAINSRWWYKSYQMTEIIEGLSENQFPPLFGMQFKNSNEHVVWVFFKYFISIGIEAPIKGYLTIHGHVFRVDTPNSFHSS